MRIFVALDIEEAIRARIERFIEGVRGFAPDIRWVRPESLHITLKFIGEKQVDAIEEIKHVLLQVKVTPFEIAFRSYGFFPGAKSPRVFWIGIEAGAALAELARGIDEALSVRGIPKERHEFSPHLTLARAGSGSPRRTKAGGPNLRFQRLQEKLVAMPALNFGMMTASEFFLYESKLSTSGSRYTKIARFPF
ncbi:MAG TPA: RNA 2',3'-cyclic phosphodiesterase [Terriglobales bacterium]|nr:RNA 2',3'-cyclic phosphodiesterase [Terriglobales bacterium]